jgi:ribosome-binding protein aMBF1 (putative translation factor)
LGLLGPATRILVVADAEGTLATAEQQDRRQTVWVERILRTLPAAERTPTVRASIDTLVYLETWDDHGQSFEFAHFTDRRLARATIRRADVTHMLRPRLMARNTCATFSATKGREMAAIDHSTAQDTSYHDRRLARRLEDPAFRAEYERQRREIDAIDAIVHELDALREQHGLSKADLARAIDKNPASVRRMLTAPVNPELRTVVAMAEVLGADVVLVPRTRARRRGGATRQ